MEYRSIIPEDLNELTKIFIDTYNAEPWFDKWTKTTAQKRLAHYIINDGFTGMVSTDNGEITGLIIAQEEQYYDGVVCVIKEFCVKNALRRNGIGTALLKEFEKAEAARGVRSLNLCTAEEDKAFYTKCGYSVSDGTVVVGKEL